MTMVNFKSTTYLSILISLALKAYADQAPEVNDNPTDVVAVADFPQGGKHTEILGTMKFFSTNGTVKVHWDVTKLPKRKGPFYYHIHENPVGHKGNCEAAGTHFNPYNAPADCDSFEDDSYCQVGDLSGKHGWIDTTCFESSYYDPYLSLKEGDTSYIVGKSVVLHYPNLKKIACADIRISDETVDHADKESKRNLKHNKDLVEASIPDYEPQDEQEAQVIEEGHQEWLQKHANTASTVDTNEADQSDESTPEEKSFAEDAEEDESNSVATEETEEVSQVTLRDVVSEGYEEVQPEHSANKSEYETAVATTICENGGNNVIVGFSFLVSGLAGFLGVLL